MEHDREFQKIYKDYHGKIRLYVARMVGENEAEDITQEAFLKVNQSLDNFQGKSTLSTWIYRIAKNTAIDHLRKSRIVDYRQIGDCNTDEDLTLPEENTASQQTAMRPDSQLIRKEMNDCIREIIEGLPEAYRQVLILSDFEELRDHEIAKVLAISLESAKIRLHRARSRLRKEMDIKCSFYKDDRNELACDRKPLPLQFLKK